MAYMVLVVCWPCVAGILGAGTNAMYWRCVDDVLAMLRPQSLADFHQLAADGATQSP